MDFHFPLGIYANDNEQPLIVVLKFDVTTYTINKKLIDFCVWKPQFQNLQNPNMAKGGEGGYVMCPQTPQETQRWVPK
jgi:hypothetical protein